jgi:hypothetical protein
VDRGLPAGTISPRIFQVFEQEGTMAGGVVRHIRNNVVGYVALFFALGLGSAWAATELSKNEVKSRHIGKGQVKAKDLGRNAVSSPKVADGSLLDEDFAPGELPRGEQGPPGEQGEQGDEGPAGAGAINAIMGSSVAQVTGSASSTLHPVGESAPQVVGIPNDMHAPNEAFRATDLFVTVDAEPGAGKSWEFRLLSGSAPGSQSLTCSITGSQTSCDSGDQIVPVPAGGQLSFQSVPTSDPPAARIDFGWRAVP